MKFRFDLLITSHEMAVKILCNFNNTSETNCVFVYYQLIVILSCFIILHMYIDLFSLFVWMKCFLFISFDSALIKPFTN